MTRLHGALLRALQPTPRHVGDVLDDGSTVHAQADDTEQGGFDVLTREPARRGGWQWFQAEQMLRQFIVDYYDPDDAAEAAERMLVALGSTPRIMPAAITQPVATQPVATTNSTENA